MRSNQRKGFTLIEIMIVILIIALILAIAIPNILADRERARAESCKVNMQVLEDTAVKYAKEHHGKMPT